MKNGSATRASTTITPYKQFVIEHAKFLSLFGAFLVFATFIVKDALRDNLKDLMSSLNAAQASFALRSDNNTLADKIDRLDDRLNSLQAQQDTPTQDPVSKLQTQISGMLGVGLEDIDYGGYELERILPVVNSIDSSKELTARIEQLTARREGLHTDGKAIIRNFHAGMVKGADPQADYNAAGTWVIKCRNFKKTTMDFVNEVLRQANEAADHDEKRMEWYTWLSYALYTLGWGLAFIGRLLGVKDLDVV